MIPYLTTILTILPLITITLITSLPSLCFLTLSSAKAFSSIISLLSFTLILIVALTLPLTWTAISFSLSTVFSSSYKGQLDLQITSPKSYLLFSSSQICGANGLNNNKNTL